MKKLLLSSLMIGTLLAGCRQRESQAVISVGVFEAKDKTKAPTAAELICLRGYSDSFYNPDGHLLYLDDSDLGRIGYSFRMSSNSELRHGSQRLFSQGIPARGESLAIIAETQSVDTGGYNLSVNFRTGTTEPLDSTKQSVFVGLPSAGSVILSNGLIVTWTTKLKKE